MRKLVQRLTTLFFILAVVLPHGIAQAGLSQETRSAGTLPAFPGAEGFGAQTVGGRGGTVYIVTNTNDSGAGSLRQCVEASGPRTCVFEVGGLISLNSTLAIKNPYLTIAGQTAPGGGITLKLGAASEAISVQTSQVIIRYISVRPGPGGSNHGIQVARNGTEINNVIIDHLSLSWGVDSVIETWYRAKDVTFSWLIISEGLNDSTHPKGEHSKGLMVGGYKGSESGGAGSENISVLNNLMAHNADRNPLMQMCGIAQVVNNITYDPMYTFSHQQLNCVSGYSYVNWINNYHKSGPSSTSSSDLKFIPSDEGACGQGKAYMSGNRGANGSWSYSFSGSCSGRTDIVVSVPAAAPSVVTTNAQDAYTNVLANAGNSRAIGCDGNWYSRRDAIDTRVINDVKNGTGHIIDDPSQVGGWIVPATGSPCSDTDRDGIPNAWEISHGLNSNFKADGNFTAPSGYTWLEEYFNGTGGIALQERILNGGVNTYAGTSNVPTNWRAYQFGAADGKDETVKYEGTASVKIVGVSGTLKALTQTLSRSGVGGESFTFSFRVRGQSIPATGAVCDGMAILWNGGVETYRTTLKCPTGSFAFRSRSVTFTAPGAFDKIIIRFRFNSTGTIWLDTVSLMN
jgi:hypothetical protein